MLYQKEHQSFFDKSQLSLQKWVLLLYMWVRQYPVTDACEEAEVRERTAIHIYQWLREVCSQALLKFSGGCSATMVLECNKSLLCLYFYIFSYFWFMTKKALVYLDHCLLASNCYCQQTVVQIDESLFRHKPKVRKNV